MTKSINKDEVEYLFENGVGIDFKWRGYWKVLTKQNKDAVLEKDIFNEFRIQPKIYSLNQFGVGILESCSLGQEKPHEVTLRFGSENEAIDFMNKAFKIFNGKDS